MLFFRTFPRDKRGARDSGSTHLSGEKGKEMVDRTSGLPARIYVHNRDGDLCLCWLACYPFCVLLSLGVLFLTFTFLYLFVSPPRAIGDDRRNCCTHRCSIRDRHLTNNIPYSSAKQQERWRVTCFLHPQALYLA